MRPQVSSRSAERRLGTLARNRGRVVTCRELLSFGFSRDQVKRRLADGRLARRHRGVYVVGPGGLTAAEELLVAALFAAPDGVVSGIHAAHHLGLRQARPRGAVDITSPRRISAPRGIRAHRSVVPRDERTSLRGVPVTTTGRTIVDCAASSTPRELERMLNEAHVLGLPIRPTLPVLLERHPGRQGAPALRLALERFEGGPTPTRSDLEERFLDFLDRFGFPRPRVNYAIETAAGRIEVDLAWPEHRVAIEVDALSTHGSRTRMLNDRRRDRALILASWTPARVMEEDLDDEPGLAVEIHGLLAA